MLSTADRMRETCSSRPEAGAGAGAAASVLEPVAREPVPSGSGVSLIGEIGDHGIQSSLLFATLLSSDSLLIRYPGTLDVKNKRSAVRTNLGFALGLEGTTATTTTTVTAALVGFGSLLSLLLELLFLLEELGTVFGNAFLINSLVTFLKDMFAATIPTLR